MEAWRERMRAHAGAACVHLIVNERREAGASLPHTHAQLYALDFVPAGDRARARALRRLRDAHDGRQPARRPRAGGGAPARAGRRDRRRGGADRAVRVAAAVPAHDRAAPPARALRGRRAARRARCCTTRCSRLRAPPRRVAAAQPLGAHRAARARSTSAGGSTSCRGSRTSPGSSSAPACTSASSRPSRPRRSCARPDAGAGAGPARQPRVGRRRRRAGRRDRARAARAARRHARRRPGEADRLADKVRALRVFPDADGRMNEPLGDREVLCVSPVHALRRRAQGQPAVLRRRRPARARRAALRALLRRASAPQRGASAPTWRSSWSTTAR